MRTASAVAVQGDLHQAPPGPDPPRSRHPPPGAAPRGADAPSQEQVPPCGQTDTCKNITFANFVCGR